MRYLCVHCDHRFEHEGDDKPRCPQCMRRNGLERLDGQGGTGSRVPRWALVAGVVGVVALAGAGYAWWSYATPGTVSGDPPLEPLDRGDLRDWLAHYKAEAGDMAGLLLADDSIEDFAEQAAGGAEGATGKAEAVVKALAGRAEADAFVPWSTSHPREGPLRTAAQTLTAVREDDGRHRLYPLEVAALTAAALRAQDVPAMLVEAWKFPESRTPPDPSGHFGYYLVGVWPGGEPTGKEKPKLFDPYGARGDDPEEGGFRVLTDPQAVGAALTHQAVHALVNEGETKGALALVEDALELDPRSPAAHTVRGAVLLQTGGPEQGVREFESAAQLRDDAPRQKNLAGLLLAQGEVDEASRRIAEAREEYPDYAGVHAMLAAIYLQEGQMDRAKEALETAERLDPHLPNLPQIWSQYYLASGEPDRAIEHAKRAVERRPHDWQARLHAGQVYRSAGRYDDMRRQAHKILEMVPSTREAAMRKIIEQVLGPLALEEPADDLLAEGDGAGQLPEPGDLELDQGSRLLDEEGSAAGGSSLLDDGESLDLGGESSGPLLLGGDGSKLKLREPGQKLQLDMNE